MFLPSIWSRRVGARDQSENTGTIFRDLIFQPPASLRKVSWTSLTIIGFAGLLASSDRYNVRIQAASTVASDDMDNLKLEITCLDVLPVMSARRLRPCAIASIPLAVTPAMDCSASCVKSTEASCALPWSI